MISSGRINATKVFGATYAGLYKQIPAGYPRVKLALINLTVPSRWLNGTPRVYNQILISLLEEFNKINSSPKALPRIKAVMNKLTASPHTISFIAAFFSKAEKAGYTEEAAVSAVLENIEAILLSTAYLPYPSKTARQMIDLLRNTSPADLPNILPRQFATVSKKAVEKAAACHFNPFEIAFSSPTPIKAFEREGLNNYLRLSKQALLSFSRTLAEQFCFGIHPLWVFLLRDAHLLYQIAGKELPGEKIELDVSKATLAEPDELEQHFSLRGQNLGDAKGGGAFRNYQRLVGEIGSFAEATSTEGSDPFRPNEVLESLVNDPTQSKPSEDYQQFRNAQEILGNITVPEQINLILQSSGIVKEALEGRPVVFVDTGYKGSLPLLLQAALSRQLTEAGQLPNVHCWVDYVHEPYRHLLGAHRTGKQAVSPLDGLVSLNRTILPSEEGFNLGVFTTPFSAFKQGLVLRPYDVYEEG